MKYMGSKRRIWAQILPIMLEKYDGEVFVDAFCGGCNLIEHVNGLKRIANDNNSYLIAMWESLCSGVRFTERIEREYYNEVRMCYNNRDYSRYSMAEIGWVGFMASMNGRFFDGGYSGHCVGKRDYIGESVRNVLKQVPHLSGVVFSCCDYSELQLPEHSLIYCDIPYAGTKKYSCALDFDYERFYDWCRKKARDGHTVFVSEYWMPDDFKCVWEGNLTNSMATKNTYNTVERLFTINVR